MSATNGAGSNPCVDKDGARRNDVLGDGQRSDKPQHTENQAQLYVPRDIKNPRRPRRTRDAVKGIRAAITEILSQDNPQTVRQVFYALTVRDLISKDETEYKRTVVRLLGEMRESGEIPFEWITDNTRLMRKPATFVGLEACLDNTSKFYRRDLWAAMPVYVEVWVEKDALSGVLMEETEQYDVPLMIARGYASLSFLHVAGSTIKAKGKPAYIYHFGDLDPSGRDAARDIEAKLRRYAPGAEIHFECPAVTREQVKDWNLPSRPTKTADPRAKKFDNAASVELDAIPAAKLRELARGCIERHVDKEQLKILRAAEESERGLLAKWAKVMKGEAS